MPITEMAHRLRSEEIKDSEVKTDDLASDAVTPDKSTCFTEPLTTKR